MSTRALIVSDLERSFDSANGVGLFVRAALSVKGVAIVGTRLAFAVGKRSSTAGLLLKQITHMLTGADIGWDTKIGPGLRMLHPTGVVVDGRSQIGARCTLHPCTLGSHPDGSPTLGDDVEIGPGARILGAVEIDDRCRVGANAVMTKTIRGTDQVFMGVPARATPRAA